MVDLSGEILGIIGICDVEEHIAVEHIRLKALVDVLLADDVVAKLGVVRAAAAPSQAELSVLVRHLVADLACDYAVEPAEGLCTKLKIRP